MPLTGVIDASLMGSERRMVLKSSWYLVVSIENEGTQLTKDGQRRGFGQNDHV
jgi:hypothetical protein